MSSFFYVTLDTRPPIVEIYAPSYTTPDVLTEIEIVSDKLLNPSGQKIYIIDSSGTRFDYVFQYYGNSFVGFVHLNQLSVGHAVIYAEMKDDLFNRANKAYKHLEILVENSITMKLGVIDKTQMKLGVIDKIQMKLGIQVRRKDIKVVDDHQV